jgi:hypothetical protein
MNERIPLAEGDDGVTHVAGIPFNWLPNGTSGSPSSFRKGETVLPADEAEPIAEFQNKPLQV